MTHPDLKFLLFTICLFSVTVCQISPTEKGFPVLNRLHCRAGTSVSFIWQLANPQHWVCIHKAAAPHIGKLSLDTIRTATISNVQLSMQPFLFFFTKTAILEILQSTHTEYLSTQESQGLFSTFKL